MRRVLLTAVFFLALGVPARAAFVRSVMDRVDSEPLFDSEYFLDLRGFASPRAWDDAWAASSGGFRVNGASLDCCDLYLDQSLVFTRRLTPGLEFRFRYTELSDKDRQETHHWLELEQDLGGGWSAELFGEPAFRKEDADIGLGLRWRYEGWEARVRRTFVDFNFNGRGSTTQRYSLNPRTNELSVRVPAGVWDLRLAAELDEATRREVPDEKRSFFYRRARAGASVGQERGWAPLLRYSYETQVKANTVAPGAAGLSEEARRQLHEVLASARLRSGDDELEPGAALLLRSARTDLPAAFAAGTFYRRWELQPYLRWRRRLSARLTSELSPSLSLGEDRVRHPGGGAPDRYGVVAEAKLGAAMEFGFGAAGRLSLGGAFDLDTPGKPWDGGSVRAMFLF
ncbi:MAG: hypothetical protein AAB320_10075 [Elusimicrobiota bacterium]